MLQPEGNAAASHQKNNGKFRAASLFTGIGGFDLGLEREGFEITFQCEIDKFCRSVLAHRWPHLDCYENIKELTPDSIPVSDVWAEDSHVRTSRWLAWAHERGLKGSALDSFTNLLASWEKHAPELFYSKTLQVSLAPIEEEILPPSSGRWPVSGILSAGVCSTAKTSESPNLAKESTLLGVIETLKVAGQILFEGERGEGDAASGKPNGKAALSPFKKVIGEDGGNGPVYQSIAYCLYASSARHTGTDWSRTYVQYPKKGEVRRLTPKECEGIMGFPDGWTMLDKEASGEGDIDSLRYHALGNAVTPPVAQWLAQRIRKYLEATSDKIA